LVWFSIVTGIVLANASLDVALHDIYLLLFDSLDPLLAFNLSMLVIPSGLYVKYVSSLTGKTEQQLFYQFFVGLIDGKGSFQINLWRQKILQFRIVIKLKNTPANVQFLQLIKTQLDVGKVYINTISVLFQIDTQNEIASILHIFTLYPLLTTNMRSRFFFFKFCFHMWSLLTYADYLQFKQDFVLMSSVFSTTAILNLSYFNIWLVGFTTTEGCFFIRLSGFHSFSISSTYDQSVITAVQLFFQLPNITKVMLAKGGKPFYLIETYNRASLLRIIDFFDKAPIQLGGENLVQYNNFKKKWC
jgi:LAGLIDADG endonuclease